MKTSSRSIPLRLNSILVDTAASTRNVYHPSGLDLYCFVPTGLLLVGCSSSPSSMVTVLAGERLMSPLLGVNITWSDLGKIEDQCPVNPDQRYYLSKTPQSLDLLYSSLISTFRGPKIFPKDFLLRNHNETEIVLSKSIDWFEMQEEEMSHNCWYYRTQKA